MIKPEVKLGRCILGFNEPAGPEDPNDDRGDGQGHADPDRGHQLVDEVSHHEGAGSGAGRARRDRLADVRNFTEDSDHVDAAVRRGRDQGMFK